MQARLTTVVVRLMGVKRRMYGSAEKVHRSIAADRRRGPAVPGYGDRLSVEERRMAAHRVYTVSPKTGRTGRHLLYLHGGGWSLSITSLHWDLIGTLAERLGCSITVRCSEPQRLSAFRAFLPGRSVTSPKRVSASA